MAGTLSDMGKILLIAGGVIAGIGLLLLLAPRVPWLGKLPGDILIERKDFTFFFPIMTCLAVSLVLTLILNLFFFLRR